MRGVVFRGNHELEILNFEDLVPGPGEAVMCGSDLHFYRYNPADVIRSLGFKDLASRGIDENEPIIAGHEPLEAN
jgi:(R,R)-butanediol dehydrogenase / meso-butanediol dehydrogenase / diacetyl reductase